MSTPIQRDAALVILVDPGDRVLLFRYQFPSPWSGDGWLTPGGGIEPGKPRYKPLFESCARRLGIA